MYYHPLYPGFHLFEQCNHSLWLSELCSELPSSNDANWSPQILDSFFTSNPSSRMSNPRVCKSSRVIEIWFSHVSQAKQPVQNLYQRSRLLFFIQTSTLRLQELLLPPKREGIESWWNYSLARFQGLQRISELFVLERKGRVRVELSWSLLDALSIGE